MFIPVKNCITFEISKGEMVALNVLNLYYTLSGNTEKVANRIEKTVQSLGHEIDTVRVTSDTSNVDLLEYELVFNGSGVYQWLPGAPMMDLFDDLRGKYSEADEIKPGSPMRSGKKAVIYCTYGGTHTGKSEAVPAVKYMGQMFDHLGFVILDEWYVIGAYPENHNSASINGRLGDIRERPNENDLAEIEERVKGILT